MFTNFMTHLFPSSPAVISGAVVLAFSATSFSPALAQFPGQFAGVQVEGIELALNRAPTDASSILNSPSRVVPPPTSAPAPVRPQSNRTLFSHPKLLSQSALCGPLQHPAPRDAVNALLRRTLSEQVQVRLPRGFGIHSNTNHQLGTTCTARAEVVGNRLSVTINVPRNRYFAQITTPGLLGSYADPNFHIFYDLSVRTTYLIPDSTSGKLVQEAIHVSASNISRPDSRHLISQVAFAANDLVSFLGGPDFIARIRQDRTFKFGSLVQVDLGGLNNALGGVLPALRLERGYKGNVLLLTATDRPPAPPPLVR